MSLWSRVANLFRDDRLNSEIDEELESHIREAIEDGVDPAEARKAFGPVLRRREESRDIRPIIWLDSIRADTSSAGGSSRRKKRHPSRRSCRWLWGSGHVHQHSGSLMPYC
jgi:hypothetical protein